MAVIYNENRLKEPELPGVSVITPTNRPDYFDNLIDNFISQSYKKRELIIVLNSNTMDINYYQNKIKKFRNIKIYWYDEKYNYGECKNFAFNKAKYDYLAFFDDDDFYAPNYLKQAMDAFKNNSCDIVGKLTTYVYFNGSNTLALWFPDNENKYVFGLVDSTLVIKRNLLEKVPYPNNGFDDPSKGFSDTKFQQLCFENGIKMYSTDRYNFVYNRYSNPKTQHMWTIEESEFLKNCEIIKKNLDDYLNYVVR